MKKDLTEIIFILDRSGSMSGLERDTIGGFNGFIKQQCELKGSAVSTVVLFDDKYEVLWEEKDINYVNLTEREYFVRGSTALLDAVGKTIINVHNRRNSTPANERASKVICVITTDGYENASREFTYERVNKLINDQKKNDWQFLFLGANIDEVEEAGKLGIDASDTVAFSCNEDGINEMYSAMKSIVSECREDK